MWQDYVIWKYERSRTRFRFKLYGTKRDVLDYPVLPREQGYEP